MYYTALYLYTTITAVILSYSDPFSTKYGKFAISSFPYSELEKISSLIFVHSSESEIKLIASAYSFFSFKNIAVIHKSVAKPIFVGI